MCAANLKMKSNWIVVVNVLYSLVSPPSRCLARTHYKRLVFLTVSYRFFLQQFSSMLHILYAVYCVNLCISYGSDAHKMREIFPQYFVIYFSFNFLWLRLFSIQDLKELRCRKCFLKEINAKLFQRIPRLTELDLGENYVNILKA